MATAPLLRPEFRSFVKSPPIKGEFRTSSRKNEVLFVPSCGISGPERSCRERVPNTQRWNGSNASE
jgi:hypothetical protein